MSDKPNHREIIHSAEYPGYTASLNLGVFAALLQQKLSEVPEDFRPNAFVEIEREDEEYSYEIAIGYERPYTDDEITAMRNRMKFMDEAYKVMVQQEELRRYLELKAKFEPVP